jgi:hypothetical protein
MNTGLIATSIHRTGVNTLTFTRRGCEYILARRASELTDPEEYSLRRVLRDGYTTLAEIRRYYGVRIARAKGQA